MKKRLIIRENFSGSTVWYTLQWFFPDNEFQTGVIIGEDPVPDNDKDKAIRKAVEPFCTKNPLGWKFETKKKAQDALKAAELVI